MARKIRFPLKMKNGAEVRTLEELKENFDLESVLGYFTDGKLKTWLSDRYYDEKADAVGALAAAMPDLNAKLCEILEVKYQAEADETDLDLIRRRNEKLRILHTITDDHEILENVDFVAMEQDELFDILDEAPEKVYLYGEKFSIPFGKKHVTYIGIHEPLVILEGKKYADEYEDAGIHFDGVRFEENAVRGSKGELLYLAGKYKEAFPVLQLEAENGNPRSMYLMARFYHDGYNVVKIDKEKRNSYVKDALSYDDPLLKYGYVAWYLDGNKAEQDKCYSQIEPQIRNLAKQGNIEAQRIFGYMYNNGYGVAQDYAKAVEWYCKGAEQGYASAQCNLGYMYNMGYGVSQDYAKAVEWFRKAAEQGYANAQCNLGIMYENGYGVSQDKAKAVEWFRKAAEQGNAQAQNNLGYMYKTGEGVSQDYAKAVEWYRKAAEQGYASAQSNLGGCYHYGNGVVQDYAKAVEWFRKAVEQGHAAAQCWLGYMYGNGYGVSQDKAKAVEWYRKAAKNGDETAKKNLSILGYSV